jgi:hypothetical protein
MQTTRNQLADFIRRGVPDEFDQEDALALVDVLSEAMTPILIMTWVAWLDDELGGVPLELIKEGRGRQVMRRARRLVAERSV